MKIPIQWGKCFELGIMDLSCYPEMVTGMHN
jgi:hypothetical protein